MKNAGKSNLQMVQANWEEIERKVREHHRKQLKVVAIIVGICVVLGLVIISLCNISHMMTIELPVQQIVPIPRRQSL